MGSCLSEIGRFILFMICISIFGAISGQPVNLPMSALCYPFIRLLGMKLWGDKENNNKEKKEDEKV